MKAIVQDEYGTPDVLKFEDIDQPVLRDNDVLLRVHAAGVDPSVWHMMTGLPYAARAVSGLRTPKERVRGWAVAGQVEAVGANVTGFRPGDEVYGKCAGSFAEYACAQPDKIAPKPANLTMEQAAAVPVSANSALQAVRDKGQVRAGQQVLIIGAGGGVGTFAVQIAKAYGAKVTGVCGPSKVDLVRSLGADDVIDYTSDDFADGDRRYDLIVDTGGLRPLGRLRRALAAKGTVVMVGGEGSGRWWPGFGRQLQAAVLSPFVGQNLRGLFASTHADDLRTLTELIEAGKVTPVVTKTYSLRDAPEAVRELGKWHSRGKAVITV